MFGLQNFGLLGVLGGGAVSLFDSAALYMDFTANTARVNGVASSAASLLTTARNSIGWADNAAGIWSSFAINTPRITDKGILIEEARTNVVLWNRDLTNAAWVKTSVTAVKDQIGVDGVAASASKITASGANGTCLQTTTIASSARWQSAFVKRLTGSGVVQMTMDNGTTWTTVPVTADWTRVSIPTQTLANPVVGFRLVTSGDAIAVDFVQNENGVFVTSPIATTTAAVPRIAESVTLTTMVPFTYGSLFSEHNHNTKDGVASNVVFMVWDGSTTNRGGTGVDPATNKGGGVVVATAVQLTVITGSALASGQLAKCAIAYALNDGLGASNGAVSAVDTAVTLPVGLNAIRFGNISTINSMINTYLRKVALWPSLRLSAAQLQAITAP